MPPKKKAATKKTTRRPARKSAVKKARPAAKKASPRKKKVAPATEGALMDVARSIGSALGSVAAKVKQMPEQVQAAFKREGDGEDHGE